MIYITDLKPEHVGQWIRYRGGRTGEWEHGRIKTWNARHLFVVFKCDERWDDFELFTSMACDPSTIDFIDDPTPAPDISAGSGR
jgi:hypothetical protein